MLCEMRRNVPLPASPHAPAAVAGAMGALEVAFAVPASSQRARFAHDCPLALGQRTLNCNSPSPLRFASLRPLSRAGGRPSEGKQRQPTKVTRCSPVRGPKGRGGSW